MATRLVTPLYQAIDENGDPGNGWKLAFYETGTTTLKDTYSNEALSVANANPVICNSDGRPANGAGNPVNIFGASKEDYKIILLDEDDNVIETKDPIDTVTYDINYFGTRPAQHWGTTTNTAGAYQIKPVPSITVYSDDLLFTIQPHITNTVGGTLAVFEEGTVSTYLTALNRMKYDNAGAKTPLEAGDNQAGQTYLYRCDGIDMICLNPGIEEYTRTNDLQINHKFNTQPNAVTIASGAVAYTGAYMILDGEGAAADDLNNITGGVKGDEVTFRIASADRPITFNTLPTSVNLSNPNGTLVVLSDTTSAVKYVCDGTNWNIPVKQPTKSALLTYDVASGSDGGSSTGGAWTNRPLNTEVYDYGGIVTLNADQFTLQLGTYKISAVAVQVLSGAVGIVQSKERIRNLTDNTTLAVSTNSYKNDGYEAVTNIVPETVFTITTAKLFALQHYVTTALATVGLGGAVSSGEVERYASVYIETLN